MPLSGEDKPLTCEKSLQLRESEASAPGCAQEQVPSSQECSASFLLSILRGELCMSCGRANSAATGARSTLVHEVSYGTSYPGGR